MVSLFNPTLGVFLSVLCDNLLLTVVVPILPELLREKDNVGQGGDFDYFSYLNNNNRDRNNNGSSTTTRAEASIDDQSCLRQLFHLRMLNENSQLGILFSSKAIVQIICNPLVGRLTMKIGYKIPICLGNFILVTCALVFAFADSYMLFLIGRSFHGVASSMIAISGMALVAELYQYDADRTRFLGRVLGAAALGVLIGYPLGGFLYAFVGKVMPFLVIAVLGLLNTSIQALKIHMDWLQTGMLHPDKLDSEVLNMIPTSSWSLWKDKSIRIIGVAVWLSTMAMAVLEPTLPVWLIDNIDPPKWQMGLVFVPDSLGYFIGTNFFGEFALRMGRWKVSMISMASIGTACFMLPLSTKIWQLALPHFALGLGLGIVDASLMPLLAKLADENYHAGYGTVYAFAQTSVALAYSLGPLVGGQLVAVIGFPDVIRVVGVLNLLFCPFLFLLHDSMEHIREDTRLKQYKRIGGYGTMNASNSQEVDLSDNSPAESVALANDTFPMSFIRKFMQARETNNIEAQQEHPVKQVRIAEFPRCYRGFTEKKDLSDNDD